MIFCTDPLLRLCRVGIGNAPSNERQTRQAEGKESTLQERIEQIASAKTPLIRNSWYVAATSDEIGEALTARWLLGRSVLVYRISTGEVAALDNRCPHRSFPLSGGYREGDNVVCAYHGMEFGPDGKCHKVPAITKTPANIRTVTYPVVERHPLVWIWMGDPKAADESLIPSHLALDEEGWATVNGYYHLKANYVGIHENLQDLSHFEHLHRTSIGAPSQAVANIDVDDRPDGIYSTRVYADIPAPPLWKRLLNLGGERLTRTIVESFRSPALCEAATTLTDVSLPEGADRDYQLRILHFITPEFQDTTHYFWFFVRDFQIDDPSVGEEVYAGIKAAFMEDKVALEGIQEIASLDDREDFREMSFMSDKAGILLRRRLAKLANAEHVPIGNEGGDRSALLETANA